jgi:hypothetical protein
MKDARYTDKDRLQRKKPRDDWKEKPYNGPRYLCVAGNPHAPMRHVPTHTGPFGEIHLVRQSSDADVCPAVA